jgi:hypothetical protein
MSGRAALFAVGFCLAACAGAAPTNPNAKPGPESSGSLRIEITGTAPPGLEVGGFADLTILITNATDAAVLLLSVASKYDISEEPLELGRTARGSLRFDIALGEYTYDPTAPRQTSEPVQEGLLLPGQTLVVERMVRLIGPREEAVVRYHKLDAEDLRGEVYFPFRETGLRTRFRRPDPHALREFQAFTPRSPAHGSEPGRESVLASRRLLERSPETASQLIELPVRPPPLPWADAEKRGRERGRFLTYCTTLRGWIFAGEDGHWLISASEDLPLPPAPARLYRDLDLDGRFELVVEDKTARELGLPSRPADGRQASEIAAAAAPRILEAIRTAGFRIERQVQGFDRSHYVVR